MRDDFNETGVVVMAVLAIPLTLIILAMIADFVLGRNVVRRWLCLRAWCKGWERSKADRKWFCAGWEAARRAGRRGVNGAAPSTARQQRVYDAYMAGVHAWGQDQIMVNKQYTL